MRLTTDKSVSEMNMTELAYNSCYSNNGYATFRDYEKITDARHMIRNIFIKKNIAMPCAFWDNDDAFDEIMRDNLQYGLDNDIGIISLLYLQIWTKADMREVLKQYEDMGTVEELQQAKEKQTAKKPSYEGDGYYNGEIVLDTWICPNCEKHYEVDYDNYDYCPNCGQHIDHSGLTEDD